MKGQFFFKYFFYIKNRVVNLVLQISTAGRRRTSFTPSSSPEKKSKITEQQTAPTGLKFSVSFSSYSGHRRRNFDVFDPLELETHFDESQRRSHRVHGTMEPEPSLVRNHPAESARLDPPRAESIRDDHSSDSEQNPFRDLQQRTNPPDVQLRLVPRTICPPWPIHKHVRDDRRDSPY